MRREHKSGQVSEGEGEGELGADFTAFPMPRPSARIGRIITLENSTPVACTSRSRMS